MRAQQRDLVRSRVVVFLGSLLRAQQRDLVRSRGVVSERMAITFDVDVWLGVDAGRWTLTAKLSLRVVEESLRQEKLDGAGRATGRGQGDQGRAGAVRGQSSSTIRRRPSPRQRREDRSQAPGKFSRCLSHSLMSLSHSLSLSLSRCLSHSLSLAPSFIVSLSLTRSLSLLLNVSLSLVPSVSHTRSLTRSFSLLPTHCVSCSPPHTLCSPPHTLSVSLIPPAPRTPSSLTHTWNAISSTHSFICLSLLLSQTHCLSH